MQVQLKSIFTQKKIILTILLLSIMKVMTQYGYFINAEMASNNIDYHYNFRLLENGEVLNVLKYDSKFYNNDSESLDAERSLQLLISDTSKKNPNFFGHPINGYYDTFVVNNVMTIPNPITRILKITEEEKKLLSIIDSLTKTSKINYNSIDNSRVLGWFKYVF